MAQEGTRIRYTKAHCQTAALLISVQFQFLYCLLLCILVHPNYHDCCFHAHPLYVSLSACALALILLSCHACCFLILFHAFHRLPQHALRSLCLLLSFFSSLSFMSSYKKSRKTHTLMQIAEPQERYTERGQRTILHTHTPHIPVRASSEPVCEPQPLDRQLQNQQHQHQGIAGCLEKQE